MGEQAVIGVDRTRDREGLARIQFEVHVVEHAELEEGRQRQFHVLLDIGCERTDGGNRGRALRDDRYLGRRHLEAVIGIVGVVHQDVGRGAFDCGPHLHAADVGVEFGQQHTVRRQVHDAGAVAGPRKMAGGDGAKTIQFGRELLGRVERDVFRDVLRAQLQPVALVSPPLAERVTQDAGGQERHDGGQEGDRDDDRAPAVAVEDGLHWCYLRGEMV